jgi:hypothetical protein
VPWAACTVSCWPHCRVFSEGSRSLGTMRRQRPMQVWVRVQTTQSKPSQTISVASGLDQLENQTLDWRFLLRATSASRRRTTVWAGFWRLAIIGNGRTRSCIGHSARPLRRSRGALGRRRVRDRRLWNQADRGPSSKPSPVSLTEKSRRRFPDVSRNRSTPRPTRLRRRNASHRFWRTA